MVNYMEINYAPNMVNRNIEIGNAPIMMNINNNAMNRCTCQTKSYRC